MLMTKSQQAFLSATLTAALEKARTAKPGEQNALALAYLAVWSSKPEFVKQKRKALRPMPPVRSA